MASPLTHFQKRVLLECLKIPRGKTITYSELAKRIGKPKAFRAAANALAKNPFSPEVPCHRIVAKSSVGGYSGKGGVRQKLAMLKEEGAEIKTN